MITKKDIINFSNLCGCCGYHPERKEQHRKLGRKILRELVKLIGLEKEEYEIRYNEGGIAVDGDHVLHTHKFYLALSDNLGAGWFFWRKCHGIKDFGTGTDTPNQKVKWSDFCNNGLEFLANKLKEIQKTH